MTTPPELDNDRNRAVLSYLMNRSAHGDVDEALGKAVKPLGDVQMFSPERYRYVAVSTNSIIFGFAVGMDTIAFRLDERLRSRGLATGGVVISGCGPEWVAFTVFRDDWPMVDLIFWARKAYVFAREEVSRVRSRVIGSMQDGFFTVLVGASIGQLDGGVPTQVPLALFPSRLRIPNTELYVVIQQGTIIGIESI
jgi:hypothetical protein